VINNNPLEVTNNNKLLQEDSEDSQRDDSALDFAHSKKLRVVYEA
jgi:hypothetical protein